MMPPRTIRRKICSGFDGIQSYRSERGRRSFAGMGEPVFPSLLCSVHGRTCVECPLGGNHTQCASRSVGACRRPDGQTTNMLSTDQYKEIILIEDEELLGLRYRQRDGAIAGFEVNLFVDKNVGLDASSLPLISRIIQ